MIGSVDDRGRPVVRLRGVAEDDVLVVIDTGFNGYLMVTRQAASAFGVAPIGRVTTVELGDGTTATVLRGRTTISWLGERRLIDVLVADAWTPLPDAPEGLLGTALLAPHMLHVDFAARTVEIEAED